MGALKRGRNLLNLAARFLRTEIDGCPYRNRAHIERLLYAGIQRLVERIRITQRFVVVNFNEERNAVRVATGDRSQHAIGRCHAVTPSFDSQLHNILRIKVQRVSRKRCASGVLHPRPPAESTDTLSRPVARCYTASACYAARQAAGCYPPSHGRRNHVGQVKLIRRNGHTTML